MDIATGCNNVHTRGWALPHLLGLLLLLTLWVESTTAELVRWSSDFDTTNLRRRSRIESPGLHFVKRAVAANLVVIFSRPQDCPRCRYLRTMFRLLGETPVVVNILDDDGVTAQGLLELLGRSIGGSITPSILDHGRVHEIVRTLVPQVFVDGEHVGGFHDTVRMYHSGLLKTLLGSRKSGG